MYKMLKERKFSKFRNTYFQKLPEKKIDKVQDIEIANSLINEFSLS